MKEGFISNKEAVGINLDGAHVEYREFIRERNGNVARCIADYLGLDFLERQVKDNIGVYVVPAVTLERDRAEYLGIYSPEDFYGGSVGHVQQAGKSVLHRTMSSNIPGFYSGDFVGKVDEFVLPGVTGFSREDLIAGYMKFMNKDCDMRLKLPGESDGNGQYVARSKIELMDLLCMHEDGCINEHGLVLEANVNEPRTLSVGYAQIGRDMFSFLVNQKEDKVNEGGHERSRYRGAQVRVVRGELGELQKLKKLDRREKEAIRTSLGFSRIYKEEMGVVASRLSFDHISGFDSNGNEIGGITDITARLGGTCPAVMLAAGRFKGEPDLAVVDAEVNLNYQPSERLEEEERASVFLDHPKLRISARVNSYQ